MTLESMVTDRLFCVGQELAHGIMGVWSHSMEGKGLDRASTKRRHKREKKTRKDVDRDKRNQKQKKEIRERQPL